MNAQQELQRDRLLRRHRVRQFDKLIHDQPRDWLIENFSDGADEYPVNVTMLMRNIIWQTRQRIVNKQREPLAELVRTFWYMHVKPTLARAGSLSRTTDQYKQLSAQLAFMVKDLDVMRYTDIGFRDDNQSNRRVGANANIILFSEKLGHQDFLAEMADTYNVSIVALGGQPSVLNVEYFVDSMREANVNLRRSFYLFSIVDYDPSGWIVRDAFVDDLAFYGIKNIRMFDLIHPDMLTPEELLMSRYPVPRAKDMIIKNAAWHELVQQREFRNQHLLEQRRAGKTILYGLEAESISAKRLAVEIQTLIEPLVGKTEDLLKIYELNQIEDAIKELILHKLA